MSDSADSRSSPADATAFPLEPDGPRLRAMVDAAMARIVPHLEGVAAQPAWHGDLSGEQGARLAESLRRPLPEQGEPLEDVLTTVFEHAVPAGFNTASPGYFAYIPGGGIFATAVADLVADAINRYTGVWLAAPGLVQMETDVLRWFSELAGLGPRAGGVTTSGGSLANLGALVAARQDRLGEDFLDGRIYLTAEAHHSVAKAALAAGFPRRALRTVAMDEGFRMRPDALRAAVAEDRAAGARPFLVAAAGGTTNTGAIDPLPELAQVCREEGLWLHVDAAYGGAFLLTERGRAALVGVECADSVVIDPHKGLFLPFGTGLLLVRERETLRRANALAADYLPPLRVGEEDYADPCTLGPELSKPFRGLRVWLPMHLYGAGAFRAALDEKLDLAAEARARIAATPGLEVVVDTPLTVTPFRLRPRSDDGEAEDARNREMLERINADGRVFLTATRLHGRFVPRLCVLHFRSHRDRVEDALERIHAAASAFT
jgi:aromatic-L-amino-acid decarboxylase